VTELKIAKLPALPFAVNADTVCVVPDVINNPFVSPAFSTLNVLNVLFPVTVMLSPEKVTLL